MARWEDSRTCGLSGSSHRQTFSYNNSSCSHSHNPATHHSVAEVSFWIKKVKKVSFLSKRIRERDFFSKCISVYVFNLIRVSSSICFLCWILRSVHWRHRKCVLFFWRCSKFHIYSLNYCFCIFYVIFGLPTILIRWSASKFFTWIISMKVNISSKSHFNQGFVCVTYAEK